MVVIEQRVQGFTMPHGHIARAQLVDAVLVVGVDAIDHEFGRKRSMGSAFGKRELRSASEAREITRIG